MKHSFLFITMLSALLFAACKPEDKVQINNAETTTVQFSISHAGNPAFRKAPSKHNASAKVEGINTLVYAVYDAEGNKIDNLSNAVKYAFTLKDDKYNTTDGLTVLDPEDDAARENWKGIWRMPTQAEWSELDQNADWTWVTINGVSGYKVSKKDDANISIFLPLTGCMYGSANPMLSMSATYWSSSIYTSKHQGYKLYITNMGSPSRNTTQSENRWQGCTVRPVCTKP